MEKVSAENSSGSCSSTQVCMDADRSLDPPGHWCGISWIHAAVQSRKRSSRGCTRGCIERYPSRWFSSNHQQRFTHLLPFAFQEVNQAGGFERRGLLQCKTE